MTAPQAFYERVDEETYAATEATQSPWGERLQHGSPPTALIARVLSDRYPRPDMRIARVAAEFLGPIPLAVNRVRTRIVRPGKRIEMLEGVLEHAGREIVSARVWRIAVQPRGSIPAATTPPDVVPPLPETSTPPSWMRGWGYGAAFEWRFAYGGHGPGPAAVWARPRVTLIDGEPMQPIDHALVLADSANGISAELSMSEWLFVPPSLSLAFERYPHGDWTLLEARTTLGDDGLGVTTLRVADETGFFAAGTQALLVEQRS